MKTKIILGLIVAACVIAPFINHNVVDAERYLSVDEETGDIYRIREGRSRAYCDGTIVTPFRARRISDCSGFGATCDLGDRLSCSGSDLRACNDSDAGSCDRGPRRFRGVRVFQGCDNSSCQGSDHGGCDSDSGSCAGRFRRW